MDFQLSSCGKQRCPKCNNTSLTSMRIKGVTKLQCSCGWSITIERRKTESINKDIK